MRRQLVSGLIVFLCAISTLSFFTSTLSTGLDAAVAKTSNPGVRFTLGDRRDPVTNVITDKIYSDGWGSYEDGTGGVVAHIFVSGSGDATLNLNKTRPNRVFNGVFTPDSASSPADAPSGAFADGWFINIHGVWQMAVGQNLLTDASFSVGVGDFRWCGAPPDPQWCQSGGTQNVLVTRTSFSKWIVTADSPETDLSVLLEPVRQSLQAVGYYHMPFKLEIECLSNLCQ